MQRDFAAGCERIVTRDATRDGGVSEWAVKFFLTADPRQRALRRHKELTAAGKTIPLEEVLSQQQVRDASDENREVGPLKPAPDSIPIDTTTLTVDQVVNRMEQIARKIIDGR
jgi:cytidylate kinase